MAIISWSAYPNNGAQAYGLNAVYDWISSPIAIPYVISGEMKLDGAVIGCGLATIINIANNESATATITNGAYSYDLQNLPSGYSHGDCIGVRAKHPEGDENTVDVDTVGYPGGRTVDIKFFSSFYLKSLIDAVETDTNEMQGKLPDDDISGSSDKTSLETKHGTGSWKTAAGADIADAVWDEDLSTHVGAGTAGKIVGAIKKIVDAILGLIS